MKMHLSTLKGYMNVIAKRVETHVGRDIRFHTFISSPEAPESQWEHHSMLDTIYKDIKSWQGIANYQDSVTKSIIK